MKKYIILVLMFLGQLAVFGQNDCVIYFETKVATDSYVEIDVKANSFTDVLGFQMYLKWDSTVMVKNSITYSNPDLSGISFGNGELGADILSSNWFSNSGLGKTFDDGTVLFTVKYDYTGDPCDETTLDLTDPDQYRKSLITYGYDDENEYPLNSNESTIMIPGDNCNGSGGNNVGVGLLLDDVIAGKGTEICIPIRVDSFVNISALQFSVCYDHNFMSFVGESNNWASENGANVTTFVTGDSTYKYLMYSDEPLNLQDDSVLIELCFLINGENGDVSCLNFCDSLELEVTDQNGNILPSYTEGGCVTVGDIDNAVKFIASNETADKNSTVCVDITSENFTNIESFQFVVEWDPTVMTWKGLGDVNNIGITEGSSGNILLVDGLFNGKKRLKIAFNSALGKTVADGGTLFQLCFDVVGDCKDKTSVDIIGDPPNFAIEVTSNEVVLPHIEIPGSVEIKCDIQIIDWVVENVKCNGGTDGKIYITISGEPADYTFKWKNSLGVIINNVQNLIGVGAGTYTVTVTDKNDSSISVTKNFTVTQPDPLVVTETITNVTCFSQGAIALAVSGGTNPYTFAWTPSSIGDHPIASGIDAGSYSVTVTDVNNCPSVVKTFTVESEISALVIDGSMTDITCKDSNDGSITVSATGGCTPYTFEWSDGIAGTASRNNLAAGDYTVTITDSKGQSKTLSYTITNPAEAISVEGNVIEPDAINVEVKGGSGGFTYSWTGPDGFTSDSEDLSGLEPGTYTLVVTDSRGCTTEGFSFEVIGVLEDISVTVKANNSLYGGYGVACNGDCNGHIDADIIANVPWKVYLDGNEIELPYSEVCAGQHILKVVDAYNKEVSDTFSITEPDALSITVDEVNCSNAGKDDGSITVTVNGGVPDYTIDWGVEGENEETIENLSKGTYVVNVTDLNKCTVISDAIEVDDCDKSDCYTGSVIVTPNGDEFNEYFLFKCFDDFDSNELYVYDRLGNEVYYQAGYDGTWNGVDKNGNELKEDSYMWVFIGVDEFGVKNIYKGTVTILRK